MKTILHFKRQLCQSPIHLSIDCKDR